MKLISKKVIDKPTSVYNLHIQNNHNYIANDAIVSNCHQAKADVLKELLTGVFANIPIRWGLAGTIPKEDYEFCSLKASLGEVINSISAHELQERGVLSNCQVKVLQLKDDVDYPNYPSEIGRAHV